MLAPQNFAGGFAPEIQRFKGYCSWLTGISDVRRNLENAIGTGVDDRPACFTVPVAQFLENFRTGGRDIA